MVTYIILLYITIVTVVVTYIILLYITIVTVSSLYSWLKIINHLDTKMTRHQMTRTEMATIHTHPVITTVPDTAMGLTTDHMDMGTVDHMDIGTVEHVDMGTVEHVDMDIMVNNMEEDTKNMNTVNQIMMAIRITINIT